MAGWFIFAVWGILGIANLCSPTITRSSYGCVWVVLMLYLFLDAIGKGV